MAQYIIRPIGGLANSDCNSPRPTAAQIRNRAAADSMMIEAVGAVESHRAIDVMFAALSARFSPEEIEQIANLLGRKAHEAGRVE